MPIYKCETCGKEFKQKGHWTDHNNKKKPCALNLSQLHNAAQSTIVPITTKTVKEYIDQCKCIYCGKEFARKDYVIRHMKNSCKGIKKIEDEKDKILKDLIAETENLKKQLSQVVNGNINSSIIGNNNIQTLNNQTINNNNNNQQNIYLTNYGNEDLKKIDQKEILTALKRGFQAPVELTKAIHFNPKHPENHNIYIPKINEKNAMVHKHDCWTLRDKNDLVNDIHEARKNYVEENFDEITKHLHPYNIKSLKRWLERDDDDEGIINTKGDIKRLLYDKRKMVTDNNKKIEKIKKESNVIKDKKVSVTKSVTKSIKDKKIQKSKKSDDVNDNENVKSIKDKKIQKAKKKYSETSSEHNSSDTNTDIDTDTDTDTDTDIDISDNSDDRKKNVGLFC